MLSASINHCVISETDPEHDRCVLNRLVDRVPEYLKLHCMASE